MASLKISAILLLLQSILSILGAFVPDLVAFFKKAIALKDKVIEAWKKSGVVADDTIEAAKASAREDILTEAKVAFSASPREIPEFVMRVVLEVVYGAYFWAKRKTARKLAEKERRLTQSGLLRPVDINTFGVNLARIAKQVEKMQKAKNK